MLAACWAPGWSPLVINHIHRGGMSCDFVLIQQPPCIPTDATSGWMLEPLLSVMRKCCAVTVLISAGQLNTTGMPLACKYLHTGMKWQEACGACVTNHQSRNTKPVTAHPFNAHCLTVHSAPLHGTCYARLHGVAPWPSQHVHCSPCLLSPSLAAHPFLSGCRSALLLTQGSPRRVRWPVGC